MLSSEHRAREARRDTQIHRAPERSLKALSRLYNLPWVAGENIPLVSQRAFIHSTLYSARGTYTAFFNSVKALFSYANTRENATLTVLSAGITALYLEGASLNETWAGDRFIELTQGEKRFIFRSTHYIQTGRLYLSAFRVSSHTSDLEALEGLTSGAVSVSLLPFRIEERPCEVILEIDEQALVDLPAHYLRENGDARVNDPQGGHLMDLFDPSTPASGDTQDGPFPLYFADENAISEFIKSLFDRLLSAGVNLTARRRSM